MSWVLAGSLINLRTVINKAAPDRSTVSDGTIGDAAHAARQSDHNPNERGIVTAMDITHDPANGCDGNILADRLRVSKDPRIKYIIWNGRILSSTIAPWLWRSYNGQNQHTKHIHISVRDDVADNHPWSIMKKLLMVVLVVLVQTQAAWGKGTTPLNSAGVFFTAGSAGYVYAMPGGPVGTVYKARLTTPGAVPESITGACTVQADRRCTFTFPTQYEKLLAIRCTPWTFVFWQDGVDTVEGDTSATGHAVMLRRLCR